MGVGHTKMRQLLGVWRDHFAIIKIRVCLTPQQPAGMGVKHERKYVSERRNFVVRELPRTGKPIPPELISDELNLPLSKITEILDDLEKNLFFLVRNEQGEISWAFPVTADKTPHRLTFSTGERLNAA